MITIYNKVIFRYSTTALSSLTYDAGATEQTIFNCKFINKRQHLEYDAGRLLNGRGYSHKLYSFYYWDIVIGADELLTQTNRDFINNFNAAEFKYIIPIQSTIGGTYLEVGIDGGVNPIEPLDDIVLFSEAKLTLKEL